MARGGVARYITDKYYAFSRGVSALADSESFLPVALLEQKVRYFRTKIAILRRAYNGPAPMPRPLFVNLTEK